MYPLVNPEVERRRALAILRALTEYREDSLLFVPRKREGETAELAADVHRNNGLPIMRFFRAIKLNRRPVVDEPVQQPAYSPRQVTTSDCSR